MTRDERGSITLWVVTSTFVMMMLVGLAVDLGGQVHAQQRAHNVAAQAARAGGQEVQAPPAVQGRYLAISATAARSASQGYLAAAGATGGELGHGEPRDTGDTDACAAVRRPRL